MLPGSLIISLIHDIVRRFRSSCGVHLRSCKLWQLYFLRLPAIEDLLNGLGFSLSCVSSPGPPSTSSLSTHCWKPPLSMRWSIDGRFGGGRGFVVALVVSSSSESLALL